MLVLHRACSIETRLYDAVSRGRSTESGAESIPRGASAPKKAAKKKHRQANEPKQQTKRQTKRQHGRTNGGDVAPTSVQLALVDGNNMYDPIPQDTLATTQAATPRHNPGARRRSSALDTISAPPPSGDYEAITITDVAEFEGFKEWEGKPSYGPVSIRLATTYSGLDLEHSLYATEAGSVPAESCSGSMVHVSSSDEDYDYGTGYEDPIDI